MAGVSDWHKQQRKKELKKNKEARIAARNERVLVEKSIPGIQKEIEKLEASLKHGPNHGTQMKVDRLKKELKLLQQKNEETSKKAKPIVAAPRAPAHEPLADPRVSIYYDEVMNPFGEPPPGRPRLFHRRGGGTTLTLREACVPGEEHLPPATGNESVTDNNSRSPIDNNELETKRDEKVVPSHRQADNCNHRSDNPPPITKVKVLSVTKNENDNMIPAAVVDLKPKPLPELPQASASVKRSKKLAVDIWASKLELEYDDSWEYRDLVANAIQGPFGTQQMHDWIRAGHFPAHTLARQVNTDEWRIISDIKELWGIQTKRKKQPNNTKSDIQKRMKALREQSIDRKAVTDDETIQDRIATLRGHGSPPKTLLENMQKPGLRHDSLINNVGTLKVALQSDDQNPVETFVENHPPEHNLQDPQIVMVEEYPAQPQHLVSTSYRLPPPPLPLPQQCTVLEMPSYPAPPLPRLSLPVPAPLVSEGDEDLPSYPLPASTNMEYPDLLAYPLLPSMDDDSEVIAPYPLHGIEIVGPYPLIPAVENGYEMSQTDDIRTGGHKQEFIENPRPSLAKVDKSLITFLPTALQRKRPQPS